MFYDQIILKLHKNASQNKITDLFYYFYKQMFLNH